MPPARPPMTGRPFQSASLTVSPKPSRSDFCTTTSEMRWNALICTAPTWWRLDRRWMSRSPPRAASVSSQTRKPSGSSVAIDPASTSCASVTCSRTRRKASITPIGSFHGSNRLTWHTTGRCGSMPYWRVISVQNGIARSRFFTDSGSMHGGAWTIRSICRLAGTNSGMVHTDASYCSTNGRKNSHMSGCASVRSMWQRHIHFVFLNASWRSET